MTLLINCSQGTAESKEAREHFLTEPSSIKRAPRRDVKFYAIV